MFPILNTFITALLSLPHSSAAVERIFSAVNLIKTKTRNRRGTRSLIGLLHSKREITRNKKYYYDFNITNELVEKMRAFI